MAVVLVAEDDAFVREIAESMIQESKHQTVSAPDLQDALRILGATAIDVLFTDIRLQDAIHGGCELARRARELRPGIAVMYATGHYEPKLAPLLLPGCPLLLKPYSLDQVARALAQVLGGESEAAPRPAGNASPRAGPDAASS